MTSRWSRAARPRVIWTAGRRRVLEDRFMEHSLCETSTALGPGRDLGARADDRADGRRYEVLLPRGNEAGEDSRDLKDFTGFFKNAGRSADYQARPNGLPGDGRPRGGPRIIRSRLGPTNRTVHRTCGAERLRIGSASARRGLGGPVCLQALRESGLCRRGNPPLGTEPFGLRRKTWKIVRCSPPRFPVPTSTAIRGPSV
jgi:hypothetical protein